MEYMKIEGFLGGAVSKLINKGIESKFGYKPNIFLNKFHLETTINPNDRDDVYVTVNTAITMKQSDFEKLFEEVTK